MNRALPNIATNSTLIRLFGRWLGRSVVWRQGFVFLTLGLLAFGMGLTSSLGVQMTAGALAAMAFVVLLTRAPAVGSGLIVLCVLLVGSVEAPRIFGVSITNIALSICIAVMAVQYLWVIREARHRVGLPVWSAIFALIIMSSANIGPALSSLSTPLLTGVLSLFLTKRNPKLLLGILGVAGLVHAGVGIIETSTHWSLVYTTWKDASAADISGIRRAASTVGDPNYLALTLLCAAPGVVSVLRTRAPWLRFCVLGVYAAAFLLTFSRGAFLAALAAGAFYLVRTRRLPRRLGRTVLLSLTSAAVVAGIILSPFGQSFVDRFTNLDSSTRSRAIIQSAAFDFFQQHWLTGLGFGELSNHLAPLAQALVPLNAAGVHAFLPQSDPLNTYLLIGAEGGIMALVTVIALLGFSIIRSSRWGPLVAASIVGVGFTAATLDLVQLPIVWCLLTFAMQGRSTGEKVDSMAQKHGVSDSTLAGKMPLERK